MMEEIIDKIYTMYQQNKYKDLLCIGRNRLKHDMQVLLSDGGRIQIDQECSFQRRVALTAVGGNLHIGKGVALNRNCIIVCREKIYIADDCIFGPNVVVYDHDHIFSKSRIEKEKFKTGEIVIEKGCWIGANVTILRGTHIGEHSVIGAGTVVKGNIPPYSLVVSDRNVSIRSLKE